MNNQSLTWQSNCVPKLKLLAFKSASPTPQPSPRPHATQPSMNTGAAIDSAESSDEEDSEEHPPWWDGGRCRCDGKVCVPEKEVSKVSLEGVGGTCGRRAWAAGHKQRVVSHSVFGNNSEYWLGLDDLLVTIARLYPEWVVRVYTIPQPTLAADFCPLLRRHPHLYICDVTNLPQPLGNISGLHPMMWRTSPLGDPQLTHLMVRDTDSQVSEREQAAVDAWLASGKPFHVMRDHPKHGVPILGGTWAARWDQDIINARELITIRDLMLREAVGTSRYGEDQTILEVKKTVAGDEGSGAGPRQLHLPIIMSVAYPSEKTVAGDEGSGAGPRQLHLHKFPRKCSLAHAAGGRVLRGVSQVHSREYPTERTRGHKWKLESQVSLRNVRKYWYPVRVVKKWNALREEVLEATFILNFMERVDKDSDC
ncbi:uncharacterized protein [Procambarus clarkii]|uniref:uncharacterized protein n=1 Tax=Procambarus clarkii TaxID=6728 RepID=UPI003741EE6B